MQKRTFRNGRLSERVVPEIQRMIDEEYAQPLSKLPNEAALAERFQVSRIVIREAMKVLQDRGVVEVRAGRGTLTLAARPDIVQESLLRVFRGQQIPTYEEMESMLELRQVLEEMILHRYAGKMVALARRVAARVPFAAAASPCPTRRFTL